LFFATKRAGQQTLSNWLTPERNKKTRADPARALTIFKPRNVAPYLTGLR
jgi:hypothetical protein